MVENSWICTHSGRRFYPLDPRVDDICIEDIAHALSNICRFTGHVNSFYSVAEHSWRASLASPFEYLKLALLLHDASEAYLCDLSRPVKHAKGFEFYREAEEKLTRAISIRFGVEFTDPLIHEIDSKMYLTEKRDLMPQGEPSRRPGRPFSEIIIPVSPQIAKCGFLQTYLDLTTT